MDTLKDAVLEKYGKPVLSERICKLLSQLNRLYSYNVGWNRNFIGPIAKGIHGYQHSKFGVFAGTGEKPWFWVFYFESAAIAFPDSSSRIGDGKAQLHRSIAVYAKDGTGDEGLEYLIRVFIKKFTLRLITDKVLPEEALNQVLKGP